MHGSMRYAPTIMRLVMGVTFILSGLKKFQDPTAFVDLMKNLSPWLPEFLSTGYGYAIPYLEIVLGTLLLIGLFTRFAAIVTALMLASYIIGIGIASLPQGILFLQDPSGAWIPNKDFAYLAMMIAVALLGAGALALDNKRSQ